MYGNIHHAAQSSSFDLGGLGGFHARGTGSGSGSGRVLQRSASPSSNRFGSPSRSHSAPRQRGGSNGSSSAGGINESRGGLPSAGTGAGAGQLKSSSSGCACSACGGSGSGIGPHTHAQNHNLRSSKAKSVHPPWRSGMW